MLIKKVEKEDLSDCVTLIQQGFAPVAEQFHMTAQNNPRHGAFMNYERLLEFYQNGWQMYLAIEGQKKVGFFQLIKVNEEEVSLGKITVLPQYQRQGIGRSMMDAAKQESKQMGAKKLTLDYIEENTSLKNWYLSNGFVFLGKKKFEPLPFTTGFMSYTFR